MGLSREEVFEDFDQISQTYQVKKLVARPFSGKLLKHEVTLDS